VTPLLENVTKRKHIGEELTVGLPAESISVFDDVDDFEPHAPVPDEPVAHVHLRPNGKCLGDGIGRWGDDA
jgi:hypothetical protein